MGTFEELVQKICKATGYSKANVLELIEKDNEQHPLTESAYQCEQCSRYVCKSCYSGMVSTSKTVCPYRRGNLTKIQ